MEPENKLMQERLRKLEDLKEKGINPYPNNFDKKDNCKDLADKYARLKKEETTKDKAQVAGRIMTLRRMGKVTFCHIQDFTGKLQLYFKQDDIGKDKYKTLKLFDIGDIVGINGTIFKTKTGEITIYVKDFTLLTKSLRPLPEKWHGLKDEEIRYRQRYVDLIVNPEVKQTFMIRTKIFNIMRRFLVKKGFIEVATPILQPIYGGAAAKPFITHHNALDMEMFLRISNELYLKRLIVGGFEKVFEFSPDFRNEGIDTRHNPEFTLMETMCAYADYLDSMKLTEEMLVYITKKILGTTKIKYGKQEIDLTPPWKRLTMLDAVKEYLDIDFTKVKNVEEARKIAQDLKVDLENDDTVNSILAEIYDQKVEEKIIQPTFVMDHPVEISALSKKKVDDPGFTERFELIIGGREYANVYSELNDPQALRENWEREEKLSESGFEDAQMMDNDFLRALEVGMPPTSGIGIGMDRFVMLLTNSESIRDVIFFPTLRLEATEEKKKEESKEQKAEQPSADAKETPSDSLIIIDKEVRKKFPGLKVGAAIIKGVNVQKKNPELEKLKKEMLPDIKKKAEAIIVESKKLRDYEKLYKETGVDLSKRKPSPLAMLKRLADGKDLYSVNTIVDAYNLVVLKHTMSIGAFDFNQLKLPVYLKFSEVGEKFIAIGEDKPSMLKQGELIYANDELVFTRDLNYKDADKTKVTDKTKDIVVYVDGTESADEEEVKKVLSEVCNLITKYSSGKVEKTEYSF